MERPKSSAIAKWGAACSPCALAKAKCLRSINRPDGRCDRCERLDKDCTNQIHKPRKKRQSRPSKTAQLEERLNSLVDFIRATNPVDIPAPLRQGSGAKSTTPSSPKVTTDGGVIRSRDQTGTTTLSRSSRSSFEQPRAIPDYYNEHAPRICVCRTQAGESTAPLESDDVLLSIFVDELVPNYPFVILPPGFTASELAVKYPFLFTTVRMIASYRNLSSLRSQNYFIMRHISEQMLMRSERSLEILQSILLVVGYYHYHCIMHAQLNNLIALANSLVADLGINKPPEVQDKTKKILISTPDPPKGRANDERRAVCGVWYMTSVVSLLLQRMEPPKFTPYIDQCLRELETDQEYETDSLLVHLVRIQHLSERISQLHVKDQDDSELTGIARASMAAYSSVFHTEIEKFKASVPRHLLSNKLLICHINTAFLRLWEPPRIDATLLSRISNSLSSLTPDSASLLDIFYRSGIALKSFFEAWLSFDITDYFVLPMPVSAQLINAVIMLVRWSKLTSPDCSVKSSQTVAASSRLTQIAQNDPGCSTVASVSAPNLSVKDIDPAIPAAVRTIRSHILSQPELRIDVCSILQGMVTRFEQAREAYEKKRGSTLENDIWDVAARKLRSTRSKVERWAEMVATAGGEGRRSEVSSSDVNMAREADLGSGQNMGGNWPPVPSEMDISMEFSLEEWNPGAWWASDFFEGSVMDQNFFDGPGNYGTVVMDGLGPS
ncbi:uncharacterized protein F4812DRAFT_211542 [Daldinia caldariorum]|uniref:uncharacterized protein n=1 Tax=Daldinia caldariorum TaxID=326644 RepID=UPI0020084748|nr:uncharacterized protein F4812DRAFT_211542 [Daldinia caldariorum]KAI1464424.1 hypothetical protein F4812DRAFT_211542 [Daldinia caldariorum]